MHEFRQRIVLDFVDSFFDAIQAPLLVPLVLADLLQYFTCMKTFSFAHHELSFYVVATDHLVHLAKLVEFLFDYLSTRGSGWDFDNRIHRFV
jgi:hypothetical protein